MNILDTIVAYKKEEVAQRRKQRPETALRDSAAFRRPTYSLSRFLLDDRKTGIIAEFKRRSPSKGLINGTASVAATTAAYAASGASGLSVLTDEHFFGGKTEDLEEARFNQIPILRKDFIIDPYQILEARSMGADLILLIAACLTPQQVEELAAVAASLDMEVLLEIHDESELGHISADTGLVGVNNRDLKTFTVDLARAETLSRKIPAGKILIAESGIGKPDTIRYLKTLGFRGFLMGEHFMKAPDPAIAFATFVNQLKKSGDEG